VTEYKPYDELTWPEVQALPRNTPMVLPLGGGYRLDLLTEAINNPPVAYLLPQFPFGWEVSGLRISEPTLSQYLANIIASLRDDGFSNTLAVVPAGLNLELPFPWVALPQAKIGTHPADFSAPPDQDKVMLIPIGHTEQHGFHLPLSTDSMIINAIAKGTASAVPTEATVLPVMPYGVSTHRSSFAGTLTAGGRAFEDFWIEVIDVLVLRGYKLFYLMNGHGGNSSFINNVVKFAGERHRRIFCATAWLYLSGPQGLASLEKYRQSGIGGMGHACELETSLILHLKPSLVHMDRVIDETNFVTTPSYYMDWVEGGALIANPPWDDDTKTGAYGAGSLATAEKGKIWFEAAIQEKIEHVREIHLQHELREARRNDGYGLWGQGSATKNK
jgi:creatinine amidohydrolase